MNRQTVFTIVLVVIIVILLGVIIARPLTREARREEQQSAVTEDTQDDEPVTQTRKGNGGGQGGDSGGGQDAGANQLLEHDVYLSSSTNPAAFPTGALVAESASVPDILVCHTTAKACQAGEYLVYFVDPLQIEDTGQEGLAVMRSTDQGKTWSEREVVTIKKQANDGPAVDPSVVQLPDGTLRMYYYGPEGMINTTAMEGLHNVYSATSTDGQTFTNDSGIRLSIASLTDPEVLAYREGWLLYYSAGGSSGVAVSQDGLEFEDKGAITASAGTIPGAVAQTDGSVRMYGCSDKGIVSTVARNGVDFSGSSTAIFSGKAGATCDPAVTEYNGTYLLIYKVLNK